MVGGRRAAGGGSPRWLVTPPGEVAKRTAGGVPGRLWDRGLLATSGAAASPAHASMVPQMLPL